MSAPIRWTGWALGVCFLILAVAGCGEDEPAPSEAAPPASLPTASQSVKLDPDEFTTAIDNPYWPMAPGTRWTYREIDERGQQLTVVVTVTSQTKQVAAGITARVLRDTVTRDGELVEDTFDWYAQDGDGTVWYLGEDTAEFEGGRLTSREGSFEAGVDGAMAGVIMPGAPEVGLAYRQEYYEGEAEDNGEILSVQEQAEVPSGHYEDVLLTKDTITIEPDVLEYKLYAPGTGPVLVFGVSGGGGREELVRMTTVSESEAREAGTTPLGQPY